MICSIFLLSLGIGMIYFHLGATGRPYNVVCGPCVGRLHLFAALLLLMPYFLSYCICGLTCFKVWRRLKQHEESLRQGELVNSNVECKQIVRLILIELCVPIVLELPMLVVALLHTHLTIPPMLGVFLGCLHLSHSAVDPVLIFTIIKPYQNAVKELWLKIYNR